MALQSNISTRLRITFWNVLMLFAVLGLVGFSITFATTSALDASIDRDINEVITSIPENVFVSDSMVGITIPEGQGLEPGSVPDVKVQEIPFESLASPGNAPEGPFFNPNQVLTPNSEGPIDLNTQPFMPSSIPGPSQAMKYMNLRIAKFPECFTNGTPENKLLMVPATSRVVETLAKTKYAMETVRWKGEDYRVHYRLIQDNKKVQRIIQVSYAMSEVKNLLSVIKKVMLICIPVGIVLAALTGLLVTKRALKPVVLMAKAAEDIRTDDLTKRLPVVGNDEFSQLARTFNSVLARLQQSYEELDTEYIRQSRFVSNASHELRTPLTALRANTSWALQKPRSNQEYCDVIQATDTAAARMTKLVNDLLYLAKMNAGTVGNHVEEVRPETILQQEIQECSFLHEFDRIELAAHNSVTVLADVDALARLFRNILENAIRHCGPKGKIACQITKDDASAIVKIQDSGIGIKAEHLPFLTDRFYRVDQARTSNDGGSGLGLAICKEITESHGGTLSISSEYGKGTTVTITLPLPHVSPP